MKYIVGAIANLNEIYEGRVFDNEKDADEWHDYLVNVEKFREEDIIDIERVEKSGN
jgi:hypothetical protein